jgi:NAD(P)-dependent dehydrogenase (short-subunit alcohol dehydrogenase family)
MSAQGTQRPATALGARRLLNRIALVTGAGGDIGAAIALRVAREGASVVLNDLPSAAARLEAVASACHDVGVEALVETFDVTDAAGVAESVEAVADRIGPPDAVVTSAGVQGAFTSIVDYPTEDLRRVLDVNVVGTFTVVQACAAALRSRGRAGAVVTVASMAGVSGAPNMPAYSASKAAILGLTLAAAKDLAPWRIRLNAISPAFIGPGAMWDRQVELQAAADSQYFANTPEQVAEQMIAMVPLRRYGTVEEVAAVAAFLLSDDASYVTGTNTEISGGSV